jgi:hypothetical protein
VINTKAISRSEVNVVLDASYRTLNPEPPLSDPSAWRNVGISWE